MKRIHILCTLFFMTLCMSGCSFLPKRGNSIETKEMKKIAELASVKCYYHNVAKTDKDLNPTWFEFWKQKNMRFWVEYDGIVTIGIDVSKLKVQVEDNVVTITLPNAKVLDSHVNPETLTEDSFYYEPNAKKPNADEQKEAFRGAQKQMEESAAANDTLMENARENAKELLENYVTTVGEATGVEYTIIWIYPEEKVDEPYDINEAKAEETNNEADN